MALFRENAVIVVTGGAGGIGTVIVERLGELGATVVACDYGLPDPYGFDIRNRDGWRTMFDRVIADHGRLDALVNNAGVQTQGVDTVADLDDDEWARVMDINVNGVRLGMSEAIRVFGDDGGRIVNTASVSGYRHFPGACVYSTSKAAVIALTEQAALDYSPKGILINAVAPGMMENTMAKGKAGSLRDQVIASSLTGEAVGRVEIASAVELLLDARITSIVGATIEVDAGFGLLKGKG
ncbi:MAG: SDR family NAD(P)-dependent oxidoreductase [Actinomycetales bacterium]